MTDSTRVTATDRAVPVTDRRPRAVLTTRMGGDADTDGTDVDDTVGVICDGADAGGDGEQIPGFGVAIVALLLVGVGYRIMDRPDE